MIKHHAYHDHPGRAPDGPVEASSRRTGHLREQAHRASGTAVHANAANAGRVLGPLTDLQDVGDLRILHDELASSRTDADRIATIEAFLLGRLRDDAFDPVVSAAIEWLEQCGGTGRIAELAPYVGLSHGALERRFRRIVGTSPKTFASILRLRRALRLHDRGASLTAAAHGAGYFDQSHFNHEFHRMTGASPRVYLQLHRPQ